MCGDWGFGVRGVAWTEVHDSLYMICITSLSFLFCFAFQVYLDYILKLMGIPVCLFRALFPI